MRVLAALATVVLSSTSTAGSFDASTAPRRSLTEGRESVVTQDDRDVADAVKAKAEEICGEKVEITQEERDAVKETLKVQAGVDADGGHVFENFLRNMDPDKSTEENFAGSGVTQGDMASRTQTVGYAVTLIFFMLLCYHQLCCRCCFISEDTAGCSKPWKGGTIFFSAALAIAILISCAVAPTGQLTDGANRIICTLAELADVSLSGVGDDDGDGQKDGFPGFLDICEDVDELLVGVLAPPKVDANGDYLAPNDFVPQARTILSDTDLLDRKLGVILSSLDRLQAMSSDVKNVNIDRTNCPTTICSGHINVVLTELGPKLGEVRTELAETLAGVLGGVKEASAEFLGDENLQTIFESVDAGMLEPLKALKEQFVNQLGESLVGDGGGPELVENALIQVESGATYVRANMVIFAVAAIVCLVLLFFRAPVADKEGRDRYPQSNHCCAGFTCFGGWQCTISVCILSMVVSIFAWPISSGCVVALDLTEDSLENYAGLYDMLREKRILGAVEACFLESGDGDLLGSMLVEHNDTRTVPSGEMVEISIREKIELDVRGEVDKIFEPLADAPPAESNMTAMNDLNKVLRLLNNVDAFYSYKDEAELDPAFPSLTAVFADVGGEATDHDPRITSDPACTSDPPLSSCPALAARLRISSLACDEYNVAPGSFEGQPDEPLPGLSHVLESINTYERDVDGLATAVSCGLLADNSTNLVVNEAPKCKTDDEGLCSAFCTKIHGDISSTDGTGCLGLCTGDPTATAAFGAAPLNADIADGISAAEMEKYCPPIAALRVVTEFVDMVNEDIFACYEFDCAGFATLAECAVFEEETNGFAVPYKTSLCKQSTLISTFNEASATLRFSIKDTDNTANDMKPAIATQLKTLMEDKLVDPFMKIIAADTMNCKFLRSSFEDFLDGACTKLGGAISQYANIFALCSHAGFGLFFFMFFLWRHFLMMYDAAAKEAKAGEETKAESGGRDDPSMYCEHGVYTHDPCPQCEAGK
jgi:hypothetical protein